jgi:Fe-S oxidoreductase
MLDEGGKERREEVYCGGGGPCVDVVCGDFERDLTGTHSAALELLRSNGVTPAVLRNERCCGHDALWTGDKDLFVRLAGENLEALRKAEVKRVFVSCPEGYYTFTHDYPRYLGKTGIEFVNTVKFLADRIGSEPLTDRSAPDPETESVVTVTYHDSCRMGRFSGLYDEPRKILKSSGGVALKEMEFSKGQAPCCGSNLWVNCDSISKKIQYDLLDAARRTGCQVLLTACDKCRIHLACAQLEGGSKGNGIRTDNILRFLHGKGVREL